MQMEAVYYPYFEIQNKAWLNFALLYFKSLSPIIPSSALRTGISSNFNLLMNESDFLKPIHPDYNIAEKISNKFINRIEANLKRDYDTLWGISKAELKSERFTSTIFKEKYTYNLKEFLLKNSLAEDSANGIKMSSKLSNLYMAMLANEISNEREIDSITDNEKFLKFSELYQREGKNKIIYNASKIAIHCLVPDYIGHIDTNEIIKLRNNEDFNDLQKSFIDTVNKIIKKGYDENNILKQIKKELSCLYSNMGWEIAQFCIHTIVSASLVYSGEFNIQSIVSPTISLINTLRIYKGRDDSHKNAKKFVASIESLR